MVVNSPSSNEDAGKPRDQIGELFDVSGKTVVYDA
jgi:hypothetical protein